MKRVEPAQRRESGADDAGVVAEPGGRDGDSEPDGLRRHAGEGPVRGPPPPPSAPPPPGPPPRPA